MEQTLSQLGELLLSSIPTIIFLLLVWASYRWIVAGRLHQVLAERQARTEGAMQKAQAEIASAESRTSEYEQRVREARAQIYKSQEDRRQQIMARRSAALDQARKKTEEMIQSERRELEKNVASAKASLQQQADALAKQIIDSILKPAEAAGSR